MCSMWTMFNVVLFLSGKWTEQEEERLSKTVRELTCTKPGESITTGILWTHVAKTVGTRSEKQCRSKW